MKIKNKTLRNLLRKIYPLYKYSKFVLYKLFPKTVLRLIFRSKIGYDLNLEYPTSFNEKLQWMKYYWNDSQATKCSDKVEVREYIQQLGYAHLLNEVFGVYSSYDEIDFDTLPDKFVMKVNHGSGQNIVCQDKNELNHKKLSRLFRKWLKSNHYYYSLEQVYKGIESKIIIEKFIETKDNKPPIDYKFFCFDGDIEYLFIATDRGVGTKFDFFDLEWNHIEVKNYYPNNPNLPEKPDRLDEMIQLAKEISKGFPHMRVDFYYENGEIIFGECTFFHFSGLKKFEPVEFDYELGKIFDIEKWRN